MRRDLMIEIAKPIVSVVGRTGRAALRYTVLLAAIILVGCLVTARAQNPDDLLPAQSAAKAEDILAKAVRALGGSNYLEMRNSECTGRYAQFEHSGALGGFVHIHTYREPPDKYRVEYDPKGTIVDLYTGQEGWTLDRGGVSELPADQLADYQDQVQTDFNQILRHRLQDPTLTFRYAGLDVVDVTEVEWVEIADQQGHTIRLALGRQTHLPARVEVIKRDPETHSLVRRSTYYSTYHLIDGIQTPFDTASFRNDQRTSQLFYETCHFNQALPPDLFTRASLDEHFASEGKKGNKKDKK